MTQQKEIEGIAIAAQNMETQNDIAKILQGLDDWKRKKILLAYKPEDGDIRVTHSGLPNTTKIKVKRRAKKLRYGVQFEQVKP